MHFDRYGNIAFVDEVHAAAMLHEIEPLQPPLENFEDAIKRAFDAIASAYVIALNGETSMKAIIRVRGSMRNYCKLLLDEARIFEESKPKDEGEADAGSD